LARLAPVDLVLIEGFKRITPIKIEVHRPSLGKPLIYPDDPAVVAVASDEPVPLPSAIAALALVDMEAIADFVLMRATSAAQWLSADSRENKPAPHGPIIETKGRAITAQDDGDSDGS
jgi:Molybdopterin guanine dinucleotide synthesis protein B